MTITPVEFELALARMSQAALRRVSKDQLEGLAKLWHEKLRHLDPTGYSRATEAFIAEGKFPSISDFRKRAHDLTPIPPEKQAPEEGTCPVGHVFEVREYFNRLGRHLGKRWYCPCLDRGCEHLGDRYEEVRA